MTSLHHTATENDFPRQLQPHAEKHRALGNPPKTNSPMYERASIIADRSAGEFDGLVSVNSTIQLRDLNSNSVRTCTLVYPHAVEVFRSAISISEPLGSALLGCTPGDIVECWELTRRRRLRVDAIVAQPARNGEFDG